MKALVLSGGGSKGAYQVGVLKRWMFEEGRDYDIIVGTSVGAINAAGLCQIELGKPKESYLHLEKIWDRVNDSKIKKSWFGWYFASLWKSSIYDSEPLRKWIQEELDPVAIAASGRKLRIGAVSETTGKEFIANENTKNLAEWVYSSAAFPLAFKPGLIGGEEWTDWGIRTVTPIGAAIKAGADEIDVITTFNIDLPLNNWKPTYRAVGARGIRDLDIMMNEIMLGNLRAVGDRNLIAKLGGPYKDIKLNIQMPSVPIQYDSLDFSSESVKIGREFGYMDSKIK